MNISGPLSISGVHASSQPELDLRPFQRVTAQVLSVTGTTALLTIEGYPIVAQLASADQAATLLSQQTAQFVVTGRTSQKITLKVVDEDQPPASPARSVDQKPELAARLLEQKNIPVTANHLIIARAMLKKHLPVTAGLLDDIRETLNTYGSWGSKEADIAAALKAAGLPLSPQSLTLASRQASQIGDSMARLVAGLTEMAGQDLSEELLKDLDLNLELLQNVLLKADGKSSQLAEQLKRAVELLGNSLENLMLEQLQGSKALPESNLLSLVRLQQSLGQAGKNELAETIREFLMDLQRNHFLNSKPDPIPGQSEWSEFSFAFQGAQQKADERISSARLRIAHESGSGSSKINPAYTRLILQVDLSPEQTIEVDLSVMDRQIRTSVTATDELWCRQAQAELPTLEQALQDLGFTLKDTQIGIGEIKSFDRLATSSDSPLMTVDIEA